VTTCSFVDTAASGSFGGGAIYVQSEEGSSISESTTTQTALRVTFSTFQGASAHLGTAMYNSLADVVFKDSFIGSDEGDPANRFFDADQSALCTSGCPRGQYGNCTSLGASCASCVVGACILCPPGRTGTTKSGATSRDDR
jgi:hypothetical protein